MSKRKSSNYHGGKRDGECYFCGSGPPLEEHHIIPRRFGGPDKRSNIVSLCQLCHQRLERLYDKSFYEWFGIDDEKGKRTYHRQCEIDSCKNQAKVKARSEQQVRVTKHSVHSSGEFYLRCRPCVAEIAHRLYKRIIGKYFREHDRYETERSRIHGRARRQHIRQGKSRPTQWLRRHSDIDEPEPPTIRPEQIMDEMVIDEADE